MEPVVFFAAGAMVVAPANVGAVIASVSRTAAAAGATRILFIPLSSFVSVLSSTATNT
jgi:hypothetical protein